MVMQRWEKVSNLLQQKAEKLGFAPPEQIGSVVMITELLKLYRTKGLPQSPDGSRRFTFVVLREKLADLLKMPYGLADVPLTAVNNIENLVLLLKSAKPL